MIADNKSYLGEVIGIKCDCEKARKCLKRPDSWWMYSDNMQAGYKYCSYCGNELVEATIAETFNISMDENGYSKTRDHLWIEHNQKYLTHYFKNKFIIVHKETVVDSCRNERAGTIAEPAPIDIFHEKIKQKFGKDGYVWSNQTVMGEGTWC